MRKPKDTRKAKEKPKPVDLSVPLNLDNFKSKDGDCFGKEWKPQHTECAACADQEVCGVIFQQVYLKTREQKVKKSRGINFLDEVNFDRIPQDKLLKEIKDNSGSITVKQVLKFVTHYSKCDDQKTVVTWIKNFKMENNLKIKEGVIYAK